MWEAALADGVPIHHFNEWSRCHTLLGQAWLPPQEPEHRPGTHAAGLDGMEKSVGGIDSESRKRGAGGKGRKVEVEKLRARMDAMVSVGAKDPMTDANAGRTRQEDRGRVVKSRHRTFEHMLVVCEGLM